MIGENQADPMEANAQSEHSIPFPRFCSGGVLWGIRNIGDERGSIRRVTGRKSDDIVATIRAVGSTCPAALFCSFSG